MAPQPSMDVVKKPVGDLPKHVHKYGRSLRAIRTGRHKYIRGSDDSTELYDVQTNPDETADLSETPPNLAGALDTRLDKWLGSLDQADPDDETTMSGNAKARLEDLGYHQD